MKSVKYTSKCLLSFSETQYILNSQSYVPMKLYPLIAPCQVLKMSICTQSREIGLKLSPMCTAREKYFCSWRFTSVVSSFKNFIKMFFLVHKTTVIRNSCPNPPNSIIQDIQPPTLRRQDRDAHNFLSALSDFSHRLSMKRWIVTIKEFSPFLITLDESNHSKQG